MAAVGGPVSGEERPLAVSRSRSRSRSRRDPGQYLARAQLATLTRLVLGGERADTQLLGRGHSTSE